MGVNPEGVRDFTERIKAKYDKAKVVNSTDLISDEEKGDAFIQITTLQPSSEEELLDKPSK